MHPKAVPDPRLGATSLLDYAEDLEKLIRELQVMPIVMGFSMGGLLAQILGSRGLTKGLVLLSPAPPYGINALRLSVAINFRSALTRWGFWRKPFLLPFAETSYAMLNMMPSESRRSIYDKFVYESGRAACEIGFWFFDPKGAAKVDESKVTCPVLIITGEKDREHPVPVTRKIAKRYKEVATYKELSGHAHWVIGEPGWQEIAEDIEGWLHQVLNEPPKK
jgi:pimeloyl-ACP methyl ester carboxylesterase